MDIFAWTCSCWTTNYNLFTTGLYGRCSLETMDDKDE